MAMYLLGKWIRGGVRVMGVRLDVFRYVGYLPWCVGIGEIECLGRVCVGIGGAGVGSRGGLS